MIRIEERNGEEHVVEQQPGEFAELVRASYAINVLPAMERWRAEVARTAGPDGACIVDVDLDDDDLRDMAMVFRLRSGAVGRFRFDVLPERAQ